MMSINSLKTISNKRNKTTADTPFENRNRKTNKSWYASLTIDVDGECKNIMYYFYCIGKYRQLYLDLSKILEKLSWNDVLLKDASQVEFYFNYLKKKVKVDDWDKYILDKEDIYITITTKSTPTYALVDSFQNDNIVTSKNLNDLYKYYYTHSNDFNSVHPVLIYSVDMKMSKTKLLDVIENSQAHLNACINRLIAKYAY